MVITVEIYKQIRKMRLNGMSQRQIAATLHISRNTVKKYWDGDSVPWERKDYSRDASVLTEDVVAFVRRCLDEDSHCKSRKQHHTAKRIYDRLVAERGFIGGETTIRRLVKELREKGQEAFVPLAFPAGDALQIDWGEATVYLVPVFITDLTEHSKNRQKTYIFPACTEYFSGFLMKILSNHQRRHQYEETIHNRQRVRARSADQCAYAVSQ